MAGYAIAFVAGCRWKGLLLKSGPIPFFVGIKGCLG
jgi:hypothetical protein